MGSDILTIIERLVPIYAWFGIGYGVISLFMAVVNFGMLLVTMLTVKGILVPSWSILLVAIMISVICISIGAFFVTYNIQSKTMSYLNCQSNPEIVQIKNNVQWMREKMEQK